MDIHDYLRIARQRWLLITSVTLVAIAVAMIVTISATPQYQSTARLFVSTQQDNSTDAYQGGLFSQQRVTSYADLLTGEEISRRVVTTLNLTEDPRELSSRIEAEVKPETVVLALSVTDPSAEQARRLTQALAEEFVSYVAELETPAGKSTPPVKASIVDRATSPESPVSPRPLRNVGLAALLGLLAGGGIAVLRDTTDKRITSMEDLQAVAGDVPILGNIHFDKTAAKTPLISGLPGTAPRVEAFRMLRTNLQFVNAGAESKVFVLTSAHPGEGKSTTACNLALSMTASGQRVVLVEGDLRRPKATAYFGLENAVGVTTVLIGKVDLTEAIQHVVSGCELLASGFIPPNPAELLQSDAMRRLLDELRSAYDVVLVDAPPLLPVTDAAVLSSQADGAILVVQHGVTTQDQVAICAEHLSAVDARLVGMVVNMTPKPRKGQGGYGYGYGYGYAPLATSKASAKAAAPKRRRNKTDPRDLINTDPPSRRRTPAQDLPGQPPPVRRSDGSRSLPPRT